MIPLTLAPALLTAGIYLCLGRVITVIGSENSRLKPKMYTIVFVGCDVFSLVLQSIGGGMAATAKDKKGSDKGTNIMIAGLIVQVIFMTGFLAIWMDFILRTRRAKVSGSFKRTPPPLYESLRASKTFQYFQWSKFDIFQCISLCTANLMLRSFHCHYPHFHSMCLPCRGALGRLLRLPRQPRSHLHDFRGPYDYCRRNGHDSLPPWSCLWRPLGPGRQGRTKWAQGIPFGGDRIDQ